LAWTSPRLWCKDKKLPTLRIVLHSNKMYSTSWGKTKVAFWFQRILWGYWRYSLQKEDMGVSTESVPGILTTNDWTGPVFLIRPSTRWCGFLGLRQETTQTGERVSCLKFIVCKSNYSPLLILCNKRGVAHLSTATPSPRSCHDFPLQQAWSQALPFLKGTHQNSPHQKKSNGGANLSYIYCVSRRERNTAFTH